MAFVKQKNPTGFVGFSCLCAEGRARTGDPFLFREMLYQLSYLSKFSYHFIKQTILRQCSAEPTKTATSAF